MLLGQSIKKYKKQRTKMKSPIPKSNDNNIFLSYKKTKVKILNFHSNNCGQ